MNNELIQEERNKLNPMRYLLGKFKFKHDPHHALVKTVLKTPCKFYENALRTDIVTVKFEGHLPDFTFTTCFLLDGWPAKKPYEKRVHEAIKKRYENY